MKHDFDMNGNRLYFGKPETQGPFHLHRFMSRCFQSSPLLVVALSAKALTGISTGLFSGC